MTEQELAKKVDLPIPVIESHKAAILEVYSDHHDKIDFMISAIELEFSKHHGGKLIQIPYNELHNKISLMFDS